MKREITGYEGFYVISEDAEIINIKTGEKKKPTVGNHGYCQVDLFRNGQRKTLLVHRIMAETFLDNPEGKRTVNHKNGIKTDNSLSNLEWATYSENHKHSYEKLNRRAYMKGRKGRLNHNSKPVIKLSLNGTPIKRYPSIADAERDTGILNNLIVSCLKGRSKTSGGYRWRYADEA